MSFIKTYVGDPKALAESIRKRYSMNESPSPDTHVFIGMFRPEMPDLFESSVGGCCPYCKRSFFAVRFKQECWSAGHLDTPVYARREEILDRMARGAKP